MDLTITRIERHPVKLPFREVPGRNMARELPHWQYFEVVEVELASGHVGIGENMCYYGWGEFGDAEVERARGADAGRLLWDDSLGGLQVAIFDAVARTAGVPIHELFGQAHAATVPIGWWCIDMPPEDWLAECRRAVEAGYTHVKLKGRPWFDVWTQVEHLDEHIPAGMTVGLDFNGTLLDAERAVPVLRDLAAFDCVELFETPIPHGDVDGSRRIREALDEDVALHYGSAVSARTQIAAGMCDGFVVGTGGPDRLLQETAVCAMAELPCWMQQVGTGITAAFSVHCAAVSEAATWPAVNCHQLFEDDLLDDSLPVDAGTTPVPDAPGLGYTLDHDVLEEYATNRPAEQPSKPRLVETRYADGDRLYTRGGDLATFAKAGEIPYYQRGVTTQLLERDGSDRWRRLFRETADGPVREPA